jgi:ABC-type uncharacterized transport system permease subunit
MFAPAADAVAPAAERVLSVSPSPAFWIAVVLYGIAAILHVGAFTAAPPWVMRGARWVLVLGFVAHFFEIGWRGVENVHPAASVREAIGFFAFLTVGGYLAASRRGRLNMLGAFVAPAALILLAVARLSPSGEPQDGLSALGRIHITLATIGVAIFALATALAVVYLLEERNLKNKRFDGLLFRRGVALETLDNMAHRLVLIGFPIFTVAVMLGAVWMAQRSSGVRPEQLLAAVTWTSFAALIVTRTTHGWRGRRAALLTLVGFIAALGVFGIYFARRAMGW